MNSITMLVASALTAAPAIAQAQSTPVYLAVTGNFLMKICKNVPGDGQQYDPCSSYIIGVSDGLSLGREYCPRPTMNMPQMTAIVRQYFEDHPAEWDKMAAHTIRRALVREFPCRR